MCASKSFENSIQDQNVMSQSCLKSDHFGNVFFLADSKPNSRYYNISSVSLLRKIIKKLYIVVRSFPKLCHIHINTQREKVS